MCVCVCVFVCVCVVYTGLRMAAGAAPICWRCGRWWPVGAQVFAKRAQVFARRAQVFAKSPVRSRKERYRKVKRDVLTRALLSAAELGLVPSKAQGALEREARLAGVRLPICPSLLLAEFA